MYLVYRSVSRSLKRFLSMVINRKAQQRHYLHASITNMITTIILALIAISTSIWAFVERYGKKALNAIIDALHLDVNNIKSEMEHCRAY